MATTDSSVLYWPLLLPLLLVTGVTGDEMARDLDLEAAGGDPLLSTVTMVVVNVGDVDVGGVVVENERCGG